MSKRIRPQVFFLGLAALLNDASSDMIYPLLPLFLSTTLGASPLIIGAIEGTAEAISAFLKLLAGTWSDRAPSRKPFVVGGYSLAAVSRLLIGFAGSWPTVLLSRLIDRTGKGIRSAPRDAIICDVTPPEERGRAFGFHRAMDHAGAVVGPLTAALLLSVFLLPIRTVFFIATIPAAVGVIMLIFFLKEEGRAAEQRSAEEVAQARKEPLPAELKRILISVALFSLANSSDAFLLLQASAAGVKVAWIPLLWAAHHVVKSSLSTWAGALSDRAGRPRMLIIGWVLYAVVYLLFPFAHSLPMFLLLFLLYALPGALSEGAEKALVGHYLPHDLRGRGYGFYYLTLGVCALIGSLLFGLIYQTLGAVPAFHTGAGLALFAALGMFMFKQDHDELQPTVR